MIKSIIKFLIIISLLTTTASAVNVTVTYHITSWQGNSEYVEHSGAQISHRVGFDDESTPYYAPIEEINNTTVHEPAIPELTPIPTKPYHSISWIWIIVGIFLIGLFWIWKGNRDIEKDN